MSDSIWIACALVLIVEGIGPMLFPNKWRYYISQLLNQSTSELRQVGGVLVIAGIILLVINL